MMAMTVLSSRGRPSKGCSKCRSRKVKCDETHPTCERCLKGGHDCAYRDEFDVLLRNQTNQTAEKAQKKWRSRAKHPIYQDRASSESSFGSDRERSNSSDIVVKVPQAVSMGPLVESLACHRFLYDFVVPADPNEPYASFFAFVPGFYNEATPNSCLSAALSAAALANFAVRCKSDEAKSQGAEEYGNALCLLKNSILVPGDNRALETLAATCLLGLYELSTAPYLTCNGSWSAHISGGAALLNAKYSGKHSPHDVDGLFQTILVQMLVNCITKGEHPPIPLDLCDVFIRPNSMSAILLGLMYNTAELCADWRDRQREHANEESKLLASSRQFIEDGQLLDAELEAWIKKRPSEWDITKLDNSDNIVPDWLKPLYSSPGAPSTLHQYSSFHIAHRWMFWRTTRITVYMNLLAAVDQQVVAARTYECQQAYDSLRRKLEARLLGIIDSMCEGVFALFTTSVRGKPEQKVLADVAGLRGFSLLWPLYRAVMCFRRNSLRNSDINQRAEWIKKALAYIRDGLGLVKAQAFLDNFEGKYGNTFG